MPLMGDRQLRQSLALVTQNRDAQIWLHIGQRLGSGAGARPRNELRGMVPRALGEAGRYSPFDAVAAISAASFFVVLRLRTVTSA